MRQSNIEVLLESVYYWEHWFYKSMLKITAQSDQNTETRVHSHAILSLVFVIWHLDREYFGFNYKRSQMGVVLAVVTQVYFLADIW